MNVVESHNDKQYQDALKVRYQVFVTEQKVPEELEIDEHEDEAVHLVAYQDDQTPVGAGRFRTVENKKGKVERVSVLKDFRGKHIGQAIMKKIEESAEQRNVQTLLLNAQTHAVKFYKNLGYKVISDEFMDAGIPHVKMEKHIMDAN